MIKEVVLLLNYYTTTTTTTTTIAGSSGRAAGQPAAGRGRDSVGGGAGGARAHCALEPRGLPVDRDSHLHGRARGAFYVLHCALMRQLAWTVHQISLWRGAHYAPPIHPMILWTEIWSSMRAKGPELLSTKSNAAESLGFMVLVT